MDINGNASVIDGQGPYWWAQKKTLANTRGHLIEFMYSSDLEMRDFSMRDAPFW